MFVFKIFLFVYVKWLTVNVLDRYSEVEYGTMVQQYNIL